MGRLAVLWRLQLEAVERRRRLRGVVDKDIAVGGGVVDQIRRGVEVVQTSAVTEDLELHRRPGNHGVGRRTGLRILRERLEAIGRSELAAGCLRRQAFPAHKHAKPRGDDLRVQDGRLNGVGIVGECDVDVSFGVQEYVSSRGSRTILELDIAGLDQRGGGNRHAEAGIEVALLLIDLVSAKDDGGEIEKPSPAMTVPVVPVTTPVTCASAPSAATVATPISRIAKVGCMKPHSKTPLFYNGKLRGRRLRLVKGAAGARRG